MKFVNASFVQCGCRSWIDASFQGQGRRTQVNKVLGSICKYLWPGVVMEKGVEVPCMSWDQYGLADEDIHTTDASIPIQVPISGPITRARARQLNHQVITLLSSCPSYLDHGDPCTLVLLRNQGEDRKGKGFEHAGFGLQKNTNL